MDARIGCPTTTYLGEGRWACLCPEGECLASPENLLWQDRGRLVVVGGPGGRDWVDEMAWGQILDLEAEAENVRGHLIRQGLWDEDDLGAVARCRDAVANRAAALARPTGKNTALIYAQALPIGVKFLADWGFWVSADGSVTTWKPYR